jgi:hypothetical protein
MPRDGAIIFGDLIGKLSVLRVACDKCHRTDQCLVFRLVQARGHDATILDWLDELTATCAKKRVNDMNDQCAVRCPSGFCDAGGKRNDDRSRHPVPVAYFISIFVAHFVIKWILRGIRYAAHLDDKAKPLDFFLGATERAVVTTLVVFTPRYVAPFIGAWVAAKLAANWQKRENSERSRQGASIALIGNVCSFAFAIGAGLILNGDGITAFNVD